MANLTKDAGREARQAFGFWRANRFLLLRRLTQLAIVAMFVLSPVFKFWLLKGNYSSSLFLNHLPMTDPLIAAESLATGYWPNATSLLGAGIVASCYALLGSRVFCGWVCPMNLVTDLASYLRRKFGFRQSAKLPKNTRYFLLSVVLVGSALTGSLLWEWINPVSALGRGIIFGNLAGLWLVGTVFLLDLCVIEHGFCGHLCPMGAMYGVIGAKGLLRVKVRDRAQCTQCMDCYHVCPEPQVLRSVLQGKNGEPLRILSPDCMSCGRCVDVCAARVFVWTHRFNTKGEEK